MREILSLLLILLVLFLVLKMILSIVKIVRSNKNDTVIKPNQFADKCINVAFGFALFHGCLIGFANGLMIIADAAIHYDGFLLSISFIVLGIVLKIKRNLVFAISLALLYYGFITIVMIQAQGKDLEGPVNIFRFAFGIPYIFGIIGTLPKDFRDSFLRNFK